jgi:hypothetical protein
MADRESSIGPVQMGMALVDALGLKGVRGILKLQITCEAGELPVLTVVRSITVEQAGAAVALLKEWNLELVSKGQPTERDIKADGSVGEARTPLFPSLHPREG